jgi:hypothetical protein
LAKAIYAFANDIGMGDIPICTLSKEYIPYKSPKEDKLRMK